MTTPAMTDQQLVGYSRDHLMHELSMLWELAEILPRRPASTETSAFVESFGIHLRNLIDFFYRDGRLDDVTGQDFLDATTTWKPIEPSNLTAAHKRADKELSHLTQARISGSPPEKAWDTVALITEIDAVAKDFAANASPRKLHARVLEFLGLPPQEKLVWIGDNVSHSNVASHPLTSPAVGMSVASTATRLITVVTPMVTKPPKK